MIPRGRGSPREALSRALEDEATVSLASLDLDAFGEINNRLGRDAGDRLIDLLCRTLMEHAGAHGWAVGRIGGDEFAVCMPGVGLERAFLLMEALRGEFATRAAEEYPELCPIISIGVANAPRDARDLYGLTQQADQALHQAKENGRNTVGLPSREGDGAPLLLLHHLPGGPPEEAGRAVEEEGVRAPA